MFGPKALFGLVFLLVGGAFFVAGVVKTIDANRIAVGGISTMGEVASVHRQSAARGRGGWKPWIVFNTIDGTEIAFQGEPGSMVQSTYKKGDVLPVVYDKADPARAIIDTFWGRFGWLSMSLFASLFIGLGGFLIWLDRKSEDPFRLRRY